MFEMVWKKSAGWLGKQFRYYRNVYNNNEKAFEKAGDILAFVMLLVLLGLSLAAIPFTAGASLAVPAWVFGMLYGCAAFYFCCKFMNCYIVMGRAFGILLDYILTGKKAINRNEQLYTMIGLLVSTCIAVTLTVVLALYAAPVVIALAGAKVAFAPWVIALIDVPCIIGTITGYFRHRGRISDREFKDTPIEMVETMFFGEKEPKEPLNTDAPLERDEPQLDENKKITDNNIEEIIKNAVDGIQLYKTERLGENSTLGFLSRHFDIDTGERRANTYLEMLKLAVNNFDSDEKPDHENIQNISEPANTRLKEAYNIIPDNEVNASFRQQMHNDILKDDQAFHVQQAVILYTLIQNHEGDTLKESVRRAIKNQENETYDNIDQLEQALRKYIQSHVTTRTTREDLRNNVVEKLGLFANSGKNFISKNPEKNTQIPNRVKPKYQGIFSDIRRTLGDLRKVKTIEPSVNISTI